MNLIIKKSILSCILCGLMSHVFASNDDQINFLIKKAAAEKQIDSRIDTIENQMLGRASWSIKCEYRVFDDIKACVMTKGHLSIARLNNNYVVNVGENHAKASYAQIRVDNNAVKQEVEGFFRNGQALIEQFKKGYYVYTRYTPKGKNSVENKLSLIGFSYAFNDMQNQFNKIN